MSNEHDYKKLLEVFKAQINNMISAGRMAYHTFKDGTVVQIHELHGLTMEFCKPVPSDVFMKIELTLTGKVRDSLVDDYIKVVTSEDPHATFVLILNGTFTEDSLI